MNVSDFAKSQAAKYFGLGVISFSGGTALGYFVGKRNKKKIEVPVFVTETVDLEDSEDDNQLSLFEIEVEESDYSKPLVVEISHEEYEQVVVGYEDAPEPEATVNVVHIFRSSDDQWDYEAEVSQRSPNEPYVIHRDEYVSDEMGYEQTTVTYYAGDDIMTDINDVPIYNHATIIRPLKFGHGSGDPNVVYIRNEHLELEWEVLLHTGRYEIEVLGHQLEHRYEQETLAHSNSVLKFRDW